VYLRKALATVLSIWCLYVILLLKGTPRYVRLFTKGMSCPCSCTFLRTRKLSGEIDRLSFPSSNYSSQWLYDQWSVGQSVLVSSPIWGQTFGTVRQLRFCWCRTRSLTRGQACHLPMSESVVHVIYIYSFTCRHSTAIGRESSSLRIPTIYSFTCNTSAYKYICTIYTRPVSV
jgi:hypothetical protein